MLSLLNGAHIRAQHKVAREPRQYPMMHMWHYKSQLLCNHHLQNVVSEPEHTILANFLSPTPTERGPGGLGIKSDTYDGS